jgi:hypothetical protein
MRVSSKGRDNQDVSTSGVIYRADLSEEVGHELGNVGRQHQVVEVGELGIRKEAFTVPRLNGAEVGVTVENMCVEHEEAVASKGHGRHKGVAFDIQFGIESSDMIFDVVHNEAGIELTINGSIVSRVEFNVGGKHKATKVVGVSGRDRSFIFLD